MALLRLSRRAEADLLEVGQHTSRTWGEAQTLRYIEALEAGCRMLAENPSAGRSCDYVRTGLRRTESEQNVVFYREQPQGILVCRILHRRMLPERHVIDDDDEGL